MQNFIHSEPDDLVNSFRLISNVIVNYLPNTVVDLLCGELIEHSIGACEHVVKLLATILLKIDLWFTDDDVRIASKLRLFRFKISKSSANREATRKYTIRSNKRIIHCVFFHWRFFDPNLLQARLPLLIDYRMSLIDVSTSSFNPSKLR